MNRRSISTRAIRLAVDFQRAATSFDVSYLSIVKRAARLYLRHGFLPREALVCGLLNPHVPAESESSCITRKRLLVEQSRFNPRAWECLTEDKSIFYPYCAATKLPVPKLHAVFDVPYGRTSNEAILRDRTDWERYFEESLPDEFVIKPADGVYGAGVRVYSRDASGFSDGSGITRTAGALYDALKSDARYRRFVIQDRLHSHPDLEALSGTSASQAARLVTWINSDGKVEIYLTFLKIITGSGVTDNYDYGRTGNLKANINAKDGTLGPAVGGTPDRIGFRIVHSHPKTGAAIEGFQVPFWAEARELVLRAAPLFWPLRTIGWDVALTPKGPILLEGNVWWDPSNDLVIGPQASDSRRGGMAALLRRFATEEPNDKSSN
jgi:hypothetical protein